MKEHLGWKYDPQYDPECKDLDLNASDIKSSLDCDKFLWETTANLPEFKAASLNYWRACLDLSRRLIRIFALALDLPETYFDDKVTHPGADSAYVYYLPSTQNKKDSNSVGIGSHTDILSFTLLWQDMVGGLQILNSSGEWLKAKPIKDTFVVNIGDFLMHITNDRFKSTVHRVYNSSGVERVSMPFFFGI